ncbi:MAG: ABC transporter substrate-binding protein [Elusimicrobia bacterium]|nr:MAG: ABC transporter substrate-binding protein [Elusimicrobiota bacterium]
MPGLHLPRLLTLLCALLVMGVFGCSPAKESADGRIVLRYLAGPDVGGGSREIIRRFEALHPGIKIKMVEGPAASNIRENMYSTSLMGGESTYDITYMDVVWVPKFAAQGWLLPLDDRFTPEMQDEFLPGDVLGSIYDGKIYRLPAQSDAGMLYYRKDLIEAAGFKPPRDWEDLVRIAKALQDPPKIWGFAFQGKQYEGLVCDYLEFLWGFGGRVIDKDGKIIVDSQEGIDALAAMVSTVRTHHISPEGILTFQEEEARHLFQEGKAVFMRNWPYAWNLVNSEGSPVKGKVGIMPMVGRIPGSGAATLGGWGWGISAYSEHPEEAWKFIAFATSAESLKVSYRKGGVIPARKSLFKDPEVLAKSPHFAKLYDVLIAARPRPVHPMYARISDAIQLHVSAALAGQETPEEAMKGAAAEMRAFVERK